MLHAPPLWILQESARKSYQSHGVEKNKTTRKKYTKSNNDDDTFHDIRFSTTTTIMIAIINVILFEICSVVEVEEKARRS